MPTEEADRLIADHVETTHFDDEATGELYEPEEPPEVVDGEDDED